MTDLQLTLLVAAIVTVALVVLAWAVSLLMRDGRRKPAPRKRITLSDRLAPPPLVRFAESWCAACAGFVVHERFAKWVRCPKCNGRLSDGHVEDAVETPTLPGAA